MGRESLERVTRTKMTLVTRAVAALCLVLLSVPVFHAGTVLGASGWQMTGSLHVAHGGAAAVVLHDGRVLIAGGVLPGGAVTNAAELYNPGTETWTVIPPMAMPRMDFSATTLSDGRVLVAGGNTGAYLTNSVEVYDPTANVWTPVAPMTVARSDQTATLLRDGTVLVVGGFTGTGPTGSVERYHPSTNSWSIGDTLLVPRADATATLLNSGLVLVAGGFGQAGPLTSVALYDPVTNRWQGFSPLPSMQRARYDATATLLPDGRVLVAGGFSAAGSEASAELYDPLAGNWVLTPPMAVARAQHTATLLADGTVLVAGGITLSGGQTSITSSAEIYDPVGDRWVSAGSMNVPRYAQVAARLPDGRVLEAGGLDAQAGTTSEIYTPFVLPTAAVTPTATPLPTVPISVPTPPAPPAPPSSPTATPIPTPFPTVTPRPTATPTAALAFTLRAARVEPAGSPEDQSLSQSPLKSVKVGTRVQLSLYAQYSFPVATPVTFSLQVTHGGTTSFSAGSTDTLAGSGSVWDHWAFTPRASGSYTVIATMSAVGQTQQVKATFKATKTVPTFTFDRLLTVNSAGRPVSSFSRSQQVVIMAVVTVSHATGAVRMMITQQLERPVAGGWEALGKRVQSSFVTTNGTHRYTISFYPQAPYPALRMSIQITLGKVTRSRAVVFAVHQ